MAFGGTRVMKGFRQLLVTVTVLVLWVFAGSAGAHSVVIESSPKEKEVLTRAPTEVMLRFSAKIEKSLTRISFSTSNGRTIPLPVPIEKSITETPNRLVIPLPNLGPGEYLLRYKVLSIDGHATSGVLHFSVVSRP